jgi:4-hydroxy-2-oxoheptanedioate aldolase
MELPVNRFKRSLLAGEFQLGLWVALANSACAELSAASGYDWLVLDAEHGPNDVLSIMSQLQAVAPYHSHAVVRLPEGDAALIKRYLDIGAQSLLIPMVDTAEQARALVEATRYAPAGIRGMATMTRAARWSRVPDYVRRAREEICLIPQIESVKALGNVAAIAATDGIDAVFIGPVDLSASMGFIGQPSHPEVLAAIEKALKQIRAAGKPAGALSVDEALAKRFIEMGFNFVAVGVDAVLLSKAVDALRARFVGGGTPAGAPSTGY